MLKRYREREDSLETSKEERERRLEVLRVVKRMEEEERRGKVEELKRAKVEGWKNRR